MTLATDQLRAVEDIVKIRRLCIRAGLPYTTIKSKLDQARELSPEESTKLQAALKPLEFPPAGAS